MKALAVLILVLTSLADICNSVQVSKSSSIIQQECVCDKCSEGNILGLSMDHCGSWLKWYYSGHSELTRLKTGKFDPLYIVLTLGETENEVEDSENYHDNDLDDYYLDKYDNGEYDSLETDEQFSNEKEESEKVDYTYYLCKVEDCGKFVNQHITW